MPKFRVTSPSGQVFNVEAPEGASQEEVLTRAQQAQGPSPASPQGKGEIFGIPVSARQAETIGSLAGWGESGARLARDTAILMELGLLTRGAGGGAGLQALSRILGAGGIGAATTPGGVGERTRGGLLAGAGAGASEALLGPGSRIVGTAARKMGILPKPAPVLETPNVGTGVATGFKPDDYVNPVSLYGASGQPVTFGPSRVETLVPKIRAIQAQLKTPIPPPRPTIRDPLPMADILRAGGKSTGSALGGEYPLPTLLGATAASYAGVQGLKNLFRFITGQGELSAHDPR